MPKLQDDVLLHARVARRYVAFIRNFMTLCYFRAIRKFTNAVKADPTYVKAYVCRSEAYVRTHDVSFLPFHSCTEMPI